MLEYALYPRGEVLTKPSRIIFLLHGYGSNKDDLISLAPELSKYVSDTLFISFNAVERLEGADYSIDAYQWFSLLDRSDEKVLAGAIKASKKLKDSMIDHIDNYGLTWGDVAFVGFSQGAMMAMYLGLRLESQIRGIIGYSGLLIAHDKLQSDVISKPPILLVHGIEDNVVPVEQAYTAYDALKANTVSVELLECAKLGHGIDVEGIERGGRFLNQIFDIRFHNNCDET